MLLFAASASAALPYPETRSIVSTIQSSKLTDRQKVLRMTLAPEGHVSTVAAVRHIRKNGHPVDGSIYHFNVPTSMALHGFRHVVVPGRGDRLVVAEVVRLIPVSEYPHATEWVVSTVGHDSLERYIVGEVRALDNARARREISWKKKELLTAEAQLRVLRSESTDALAKLGLAVLLDAFTRDSAEERARNARSAASDQARACDDLMRQIADMESRLQ